MLGSLGLLSGALVDVKEQGEWDWSDTGGGRVLVCVLCELSTYSKVDGAHVVQSWVWGPHAGEDLPHRAKVLLDRTFFNVSAFRRQHASADAVGEELEDWDGVGDGGEVGADVEGGAVDVPLAPRDNIEATAAGGHTCAHVRDRRTVFVQCAVSGGRWESVQDVSCVKKWLKKRKKSVSVRCQRREAASAIPFFAPGRYPMDAEQWASRSMRARTRRRTAAGDVREIEPRRAQETAAKLSHPCALFEWSAIHGRATTNWPM